jgi:hypothetical protein
MKTSLPRQELNALLNALAACLASANSPSKFAAKE